MKCIVAFCPKCFSPTAGAIADEHIKDDVMDWLERGNIVKMVDGPYKITGCQCKNKMTS